MKLMNRMITQNDTNWNATQIKYMHIWANPADIRSDEEIAQSLRVGRKTLYRWRHLDGFMAECYKILNNNILSRMNKIMGAQATKAERGDTPAARLVSELLGKLNQIQNQMNIDKALIMPVKFIVERIDNGANTKNPITS